MRKREDLRVRRKERRKRNIFRERNIEGGEERVLCPELPAVSMGL